MGHSGADLGGECGGLFPPRELMILAMSEVEKMHSDIIDPAL